MKSAPEGETTYDDSGHVTNTVESTRSLVRKSRRSGGMIGAKRDMSLRHESDSALASSPSVPVPKVSVRPGIVALCQPKLWGVRSQIQLCGFPSTCR